MSISTRTKTHSGRLAAGSTLLAISLTAGSAHAADRYWNGASSSAWFLPLNWSAFPNPATDRAVFDGAATRFTVDLGGSSGAVQAMKFDSPTPYVFSNGTVWFGNLSTVSAGALVTHTFNTAVWVEAGSTWSIDEQATIEVAGLFRPTGEPSGFPEETLPFSKNGGGTLVVSGDNGDVYTDFQVDGGAVILRNGNAIPDRGLLKVVANATLTVEDDETIGTLWGGGDVELGSSALRLVGTVYPELSGFSGTLTGDDDSALEMDAPAQGWLRQQFAGSVQVGSVNVSRGIVEIKGGALTLPDVATADLIVSGDQAVFEVTHGGTVQLPSVASLGSYEGGGLVTNGGSMLISQNGASVTGSRVDIGNQGGQAELTVSDGGLLDISLGQDPVVTVALSPGGGGDGVLTVASGGEVHTKYLIAGLMPGDEGSVEVTGSGSTLVGEHAYLGGFNQSQFGGVGALSITGGGAVTLSGNLDIFTESSSVTVNGGVLTVNAIVPHLGISPVIPISDPVGGSALVLDADGATTINYEITDGPGGSGSVEKIGLGDLALAHGCTHSGGLTMTEGGLTLQDPTFQFASLTGSGPVDFAGQRIIGTGAIGGTLTVGGTALLAPSDASGTGIGRIECGSLDLGGGTLTAIQLGGANSFDQVYVEGAAALAGALQLSYTGGFTASPGDWFEIIDAGDITGEFGVIAKPDLQNWKAYRAGGSLWVGICDAPGACLADCIDEVFVYRPREGVSSVVGEGSLVVLNRGSAGVEIAAITSAGGTLATIPGPVNAVENMKAMALDGTRLAIAGGAPRLYDLSDPTNPTLLWTGSLEALNVAIEGDLLAVADWYGLALYDITNPAAPVMTGSLSAPIPEGNSATVTFHEGRLYWCWQSDIGVFGEMVILDVDDPSNPVQLGSINAANFVSEPLFKGDIMLLSNAVGVRAIDISDETHPTEVASVTLPGNDVETEAALVGGRLYRISPAGLTAVDVSNPSAPVVIDTLEGFDIAAMSGAPYNRGGVTSIGGTLCIAGWHGMSLVDVSACETACVGDIDGDGTIAFGDLLAVLSSWGTCAGCPSDLDGSGTVDFADVLAVLSAWGPCD